MRQSGALLGRLSRLARSPAQATQPLHALSRLTGADDSIIAFSALHRFLSTAVADSAHQAALPSSDDVLHQTSVQDTEDSPGTAGQPNHTSPSQTSPASHGTESGSSAEELSSGGGSSSLTGPSQEGWTKHAHQAQQQQSGRASHPRKSTRELEAEMDALLKQRKPGAH